jgi:hypothetical protein
MKQSVNIKGKYPGIRISKGRVMSVNKNTLRLLGCPKHILFWHSPKANTLFIAAANEQSPLSFHVADSYYRTKSGFQLENSQFIRAVLDYANWDNHETCAVDGEYLDTPGMVAFRLNETRIKEDDYSYE